MSAEHADQSGPSTATTCDGERHYTGESDVPDGPCDCPKLPASPGRVPSSESPTEAATDVRREIDCGCGPGGCRGHRYDLPTEVSDV